MGLLALGRGLLVAACVCAGPAAAAPARADDPAGAVIAMRTRLAVLGPSLAHNPFHRPLHLESTEGSTSVSGEIAAVIDHPFAVASAALHLPAQWCDVLILHFNTKYCRPAGSALLQVSIGKKHDQPVEDAHRFEFVFRLAARTPDYLQVRLGAAEGPMGTRDYQIVLEAVPTDDGRTFIRLSYSYSYGAAGRLAIRVYLGTAGREKVGFTLIDTERAGGPRFIGGMRGLVERNTMRYYLAIEAYLGALSAPPATRVEKSLRDWFRAAERFPRQLHEMEQGDYLEMKRKEYSRQQAALGASR